MQIVGSTVQQVLALFRQARQVRIENGGPDLAVASTDTHGPARKGAECSLGMVLRGSEGFSRAISFIDEMKELNDNRISI